MLSLYQWLLVFAAGLIVTIMFGFSQSRRQRFTKKIRSLVMPTADRQRKELPDYLLPLYGKQQQPLYVTDLKLFMAQPLLTSDMTNQGVQVDTSEDGSPRSKEIVALDPQIGQQHWVTLPENFTSLKGQTQTPNTLPTATGTTTFPAPINIRQKYQPVRPDFGTIPNLGSVGS